MIVLFISLLGVSYLLWNKLKDFTENRKNDQTVLMLQNQIIEMTKQFNERMREQNSTINNQLQKSNEVLQKQFGLNSKQISDINTHTSKIIQEVTERLSKLDETNKKVVSFAEQMKSLENILKSPKQRGILGEIFLENMLSTILPPEAFKMQYMFEKDRKIVDAAIFLQEKILPIDAKFSLELYNQIVNETDAEKRDLLERDFKKSIKIRIDETSQYVRSNEGTTEFAMMYVPADGIFYNLLSHQVGSVAVNSKNLIEYAFEKRVIMVSPMTFFAYLQTVMQYLKELNIGKNVDEIKKRIGLLGKHLKSYDAFMQGLGKNLETTVNKYNSAYHEFKKVNKDVYAITEGQEGGEVEVLEIERPVM
ncbi:hypothetical protein A2483_00295 [Candidatus Peregrinibacteria bacterium RIFOXYC2_FULL_33_13]|nr:MAG: hypothetical protein A2483_00295 [Candidatus Peregrinibacteria bacterium RIFOXYC2_FULL_33_13]